jgi:hypothetical protein
MIGVLAFIASIPLPLCPFSVPLQKIAEIKQRRPKLLVEDRDEKGGRSIPAKEPGAFDACSEKSK